VARILLVGGGARGRLLAGALVAEGHAVRITTRTEAGRSAIEATGAECWIGTPDRVASLRYALENVTLAAWLLGTASGPPAQLAALHTGRLEFFCSQTIDTTVRGLIYEAAGCAGPELLAAGARLVEAKADYNEIPHRILLADPADTESWLTSANAAVAELLADGRASTTR
jgi:3-hydroxyisobutyrate dehydrogenase-like beta-hydroxyacid dehydrogenase